MTVQELKNKLDTLIQKDCALLPVYMMLGDENCKPLSGVTCTPVEFELEDKEEIKSVSVVLLDWGTL